MSAPSWLAELMVKHQYSAGLNRSARICTCGHYEKPREGESLNETHGRHLAEVIAAEMRVRLESDEMRLPLVQAHYDGRLWEMPHHWQDYELTDRAPRMLAAVTDELLGGSDADE